MKKTKQNRWTITGIDIELERETKADAAKKGITHGQYVSEALIYFNLYNRDKKTKP